MSNGDDKQVVLLDSFHAQEASVPGVWLVLLISFLLSGCQIEFHRSKQPNFGSYRVVGYVRSHTDINSIAPEKLTHVNFAFAKLDEDGKLYLEKEGADQRLSQLVALKNRNEDLKILLSIGGWAADHFSDAALTPAARRQFAEQIVDFVLKYDLDGVDLDWEYPGQSAGGIKSRPEDKENFTLLLRTVRTYLDGTSENNGRRYLLTIATSGSRRYFEHTEMEQLHQYLDFINVMTYDFYTSGSPTTGHHAGLYQTSYIGETEKNVTSAVARHLEAGIPAEKIVIGLAFYGRGWTGVDRADSGLYKSFDRFTQAYTYKQLQTSYIDARGFNRFWDDSAKAPFLWNADSTTFISYEDPESLKYKADYVQQQNLGGVMFWEYSQDANSVLLDTLVKALRQD